MSAPLRFHLDDRGVSRALLDLWIPAVDPDVIWIIGGALPDDDMEREIVPFIALSSLDVAAVAAEAGGDGLRVLAVFCSVEALKNAALMGLPAGRVTIGALGTEEADIRVAATVHLLADELAVLRSLEEREWSFEIQALPNVTPRPWKPSDEVET